MYYYLTVSYDIPDLMLLETSVLQGPFKTLEERATAYAADMADRDLECSEIVNVTFLTVDEDGRLRRTESLVPTAEGYESDEDADDEEDDE